MALQLTDYLPVNRDDAGTVTALKTQVSDIVGLVPGAVTPTLQAVTEEGSTTDQDVTLAGVTADSVAATGDVTSGSNISLVAATGEVQATLIDGGVKDLGGGEYDYPDP
jgi:hypothetical protein